MKDGEGDSLFLTTCTISQRMFLCREIACNVKRVQASLDYADSYKGKDAQLLNLL
jgi:hypothetical protein